MLLNKPYHMSNKIQELTDKLYKEGLSKGQEEGERLLAQAKQEAKEIKAKAEAEAKAIVEAAEDQAAKMKAKAESDIKMASEQCLQATRKDIEELLVNAISSEKVDTALSDAKFVKGIISAVAEKFSTSESTDLKLILPEALQKELEPWVSSELKKVLGKEVQASFSKKISGGFSIGPKDGSWFVSLSDETFKELIAEYIRPVTRKILFG